MPLYLVQDNSGKQITVKSKLETKIVSILNSTNKPWKYEVTKISYVIPESVHTYTVDFSILNSSILIEGKGYLSDHTERSKYLQIKEQYPDIDLRFVFENPNKLCGGMKQTHAEWATKHAFKFCSIRDVETIKEWVNE